jgi:hypothetical protein
MNVQELRLGNYVDYGCVMGIGYREGELGVYLVHNPLASSTRFFKADAIAPIELTEAKILALGFVKIKRKGRYGDIYARSVLDSDFCIERDFNKHTSYFFGIEYTDSPFPEDTDKTYNFSYDLKYVHQLQNLFFAITHQELNYI